MKENERQAIRGIVSSLKENQFGSQDQLEAVEGRFTARELLRLAGQEMESTVNPWSQEIVKSGLYDQIRYALRNQKIGDKDNVHRVSLSDEIVFPNRQKLHTGWFNIDSNKRSGFEAPIVNVEIRPLFGMGFGAAILYSSQDLTVDLTYPEDLLFHAHPILTLEFAEQIKSGDVWKQIERSLTSEILGVATQEDRRAFEVSRRRLGREYQAKWGQK